MFQRFGFRPQHDVDVVVFWVGSAPVAEAATEGKLEVCPGHPLFVGISSGDEIPPTIRGVYV